MVEVVEKANGSDVHRERPGQIDTWSDETLGRSIEFPQITIICMNSTNELF